ncbi:MULTISPECIES: isochorismatase family cysteine hydrolase [unclassified Clostridium]|uniref:cysteine hydrolase family protein n=1 Tax=unclassified Clostridium TaxID=2614128 RepID=UPI000297AB8A|nr:MULTISPECIES: isochorismatase family cysteine hydrolase [unclassified Clostridium]EKQ57501.1 MAG: nicotinamidase-like amidase [Clostridium sp. Maddingley MBC34-26]
MKSALLIIDMQKIFKDLKYEEFERLLIPNISKALNIARNKNVPIIYVRTLYRRNKSNWPRVRLHQERMWCEEGSWESEFVDELLPLKEDLIINKCRFTAFYNTNLESYLYENKIEHIYLAGYATDVCIRFTAVDAYNRDILVSVLKDCVLSESENNGQAIEYLRLFIKSTILSLEELEKDISEVEER